MLCVWEGDGGREQPSRETIKTTDENVTMLGSGGA